MMLDKIVCSECVEFMQTLPDNCIDLTVTSPPYDNLRDYKGYTFNFEAIANQLFRITKQGGVVVWVVGDQTVNGSETGTSFRQALYFKEIGFNLHDTMIYVKNAMPFPSHNRYNQCFEYMFVLSRGNPVVFNAIIENTVHRKRKGSSCRQPDGSFEIMKYEMAKENRKRFNVWDYSVGMNRSSDDVEAFDHPAIFPEKLAQDHILSWSNEGDLVFDPLCGSGTTCKMALKNNRHYLGVDICQDYVDIANERIRVENAQLKFEGLL